MENVDLEHIRTQYRQHIKGRTMGNLPRWRGLKVQKFPGDLILYAEVIFKRKPDYIIEAGSGYGGSPLFFGDLLMLSGGRKVFSIDINLEHTVPHPMVQYIHGTSTDRAIVEQLKKDIKDASVMVTLDSNHSKEHVAEEMDIYADIVTKKQYLVVEDCYARGPKPHHPYYAVQEFLEKRRDFRLFENEKKFIFAATRGGWLRKI